VDRARAVAGRGLEGDRYVLGKGSFSHWRGTGRALTVVEAEALEDAGVGFAEARRNVVVRGIALNDLVGERFRIGEVELWARRLCEPCSHLEKLTERDGLMRDLAGRGGIRVDVLTDGEIAVGDPVGELPER
jgi:MOSC domain-containing protein YiiM